MVLDCDKVIVDDFDSALNYAAVNRFGMQNNCLLSSVDNLSVGKLEWKGI
jgi:hypothetical protein